MKNIVIRTVLMLIVSIFSINISYAQHVKHYAGSGVFNHDIQQQRDATVVERTFTTALFGTMEEEQRIVRNDLVHISSEQLIAKLHNEIAKHMGSEFNPNNPSAYTVTFLVLRRGTPEYENFWNGHQDGYVIDAEGENFKFHYVDPRGGSTANGDKEECIIAIITEIATGRSALVQATCGNPICGSSVGSYIADTKPIFDGQNVNYVNVNFNQPAQQSVVLRKQTTQWDEDHANNNLKRCNTGKTLLIVGAATLVAAVIIYELCHKSADHLYNNGFQGGSGPSGANGGGGGSQSW